MKTPIDPHKRLSDLTPAELAEAMKAEEQRQQAERDAQQQAEVRAEMERTITEYYLRPTPQVR